MIQCVQPPFALEAMPHLLMIHMLLAVSIVWKNHLDQNTSSSP